MTRDADLLPEITRPDAEVSTFSEWTTGSPERQHAAADAAIEAWTDRDRPDGMLSYTCFLSTDGSTLRHHTQWTDDDARRRIWSAESARTIDKAVPGIERDGLAAYDLHRTYLAAGPERTGCVVMVTVEFDGPDRDRQTHWIDTVVSALETDPVPPQGLIAAHFHRSLDDTKVVNYAEWTSEQAHRDALDAGPGGVAQKVRLEWRRVAEFSGVTDDTNVKRYCEHRSLTMAASTA